MKKVLKNKAIVISFLIVVSLTLFSCLQYSINNKKMVVYYENLKENCRQNMESKSNCDAILQLEVPKLDTYTIFFSIVVDGPLRILCEFGPLFILIPAIWCLSKEMKNSFIKNYSLRDNYKNYLKHVLKSAYKCVWILPVVMIIVFVISCFLAKGNFNYFYALEHSYSTFDEQYLSHFGLFFISFILNLLFFSIFYANLGLIYVKKNKSIVVAIIEAYLTFIGIEIVNEVIITTFFYKILHIEIQYLLNIYDIYSYKYVFGIFPYLIVGFMCAFLSTLIVFFCYNNKEKTIIDCEMIKEV